MRTTNDIAVSELGVQLSGKTILDNVALELHHGEVISVIGPSGCGKTTLLNVVAGLVAYQSGTAQVGGKAITGPGPDRTVVFQEDAVFPWMTVLENIRYPLKIAKSANSSAAKETVARLIEMVGLSGYEDLFPKQLSGGQRKRVDLARALAANPQVLLMDEPYAALDQMTKQRLQGEYLRIVEQENITSLFVTHDLEEAIFVADRIAVMSANPGRIKEILEVPFSHPRDESIRTHPEFQALRQKLSDLIFN